MSEILYMSLFTDKSYYNEHREKILAKSRQKTRCECGVDVAYSNRKCHLRTLRHKIYLQQLQNEQLQHQRANT